MRTTSQNTQTTKTVSQGESRYGTAEPQIEIRLPKGTSHRLVSAALHKLAADVELAQVGGDAGRAGDGGVEDGIGGAHARSLCEARSSAQDADIYRY